MQKSWLGILELLCDIPCEAEIWILVNCAWDQARDVGRIAKDVGERIREGRGGLDRRKVNLANVIAAGCPRPAFVQVLFDDPMRKNFGTHESVNPKVDFAWLHVICRDILETLR